MAASIVLGLPVAGVALVLVAAIGGKNVAVDQPALMQIESGDEAAFHCTNREFDFLNQFSPSPTPPASQCDQRGG